MTFEELKKKLKQAQNIKILFQELENNEFIATIKGIINNMEKKKRITNEDLLNIMTTRFDMVESRLDKVESRLDKVESRLDNLERDVSELKIKVNNIDDRLAIIEREAIKHGWDLNSDQ